ncbi:hypothetical protein Tco_0088720 [Tanacetum coccineum]
MFGWSVGIQAVKTLTGRSHSQSLEDACVQFEREEEEEADIFYVVMSADSAVTYTSVSLSTDHEYSHLRSLYERLAPTSEAPIPILSPSFLAPRIRPPHTRAAIRQMRATTPSTYHSLLPSGTPPLLPIPLPAPSTSRRADIPEADTPPRKRLLLTTPKPGYEIRESSATTVARQPGPTIETRL